MSSNEDPRAAARSVDSSPTARRAGDGRTPTQRRPAAAGGASDSAAVPPTQLATAAPGAAPGAVDGEVEQVLELMATGFVALSRDWRITYLNSEAERILGRERDQLVGRNLWEEFPGAEELEFGVEYRRAMLGEPRNFDAFYPGLGIWFELRAVPTEQGLSVYFRDITERKSAQQVAAAASARFRLLASVSAELSGTLDAQVAVGRLARLVVPALADWCLVTLVDSRSDTGSLVLRDIGSAHFDGGRQGLLDRYAEDRHESMTESSYTQRALRSRQPQIVTIDIDAAIEPALVPGRSELLLRQLAPAAAAVFPLVAGDRVVGLLTLYNGAARGAFTQEQLETAADVASRAALAVNNARLYTEQRHLAEGLQRSLLTAPPEPDHLHIVVRYNPAVQVAQVGGDWYDAFIQPDGATMVVIGDVVGHDTAAAAGMGQLRSLLRGIAAHTGDGPAEVLCAVDTVMETLQVQTTATVITARFEQTDEERQRGVTRLRWSNAGHPPMMVVEPDGSVTVLAAAEADLLLGMDPQSVRTESVVVLEHGSTVFFYTDGLVERRGQSLDEGIHRLREALEAFSERTLDDLCDLLLAALLPDEPDDDVALVAVRLHRQDRPRPAEAGPERLPSRRA